MQKIKKKVELEIKVIFEASRQAQVSLINAYEQILPSIGRKTQVTVKQAEVETEAKRRVSK